MTTDIKSRVREAFTENDEPDAEAAWRYMDALRPAWRETAQSVRRTGLLILGVIVLFELVRRGDIADIKFGGVQIEDISQWLAVLPPLVGYLFLSLSRDSVHLDDIYHAHTSAFAVWHPAAEKLDLDTFLQPQTPLYVPTGGSQRDEHMDAGHRLVDRLSVLILVLLVLLVPVAFTAYAGYVLIDTTSNVVACISTAAAALLVGSAIAVWWMAD